MGGGVKSSWFWRRPDRKVWFLFLGSMVVFVASMLTLREGLRFVSRPLDATERRIVGRALEIWASLGTEEDLRASTRLRDLLSRDLIRAMDRASFERREERITLGYTDERGRILLNPSICFGSYHTLGPALGGGIQDGDVVRTLSTLYHEDLHREHGAPEAAAYESEWRFLGRVRVHLEGSAPRTRLLVELRDWESDMPGRVEAYVGAARMAQIRRAAEPPPR